MEVYIFEIFLISSTYALQQEFSGQNYELQSNFFYSN